MQKEFTNSLIYETSPYLLQHAHNPVNWFPWNDLAWKKASSENKLVLVSIGYSSCHWCHVMEHETFEDESAAALMNEHYVCIKVDREERPDVDHVYMSAVQLMTGQGGWPLNSICLPNGKPIFGGTYFPKLQWMSVLNQLQQFYSLQKDKANEYAEELTLAIRKMESVIRVTEKESFSRDVLREMIAKWKKGFDTVEGGPDRAPKFPMPNNLEFLLHYSLAEKDDEVKNHVLLTLDKMADGGIYDHVGGGFSRYSTDIKWKVPHFEKMLYDNAQLVSVYAHAYQVTGKERYKEVLTETLDFIEREMTSPEGGFYSALDADSEGVEGKYYVWKKEELEKILSPGNFNIIADFFNVNNKGFWEHENYILLRNDSQETIAARNGISVEELKEVIVNCKKILLEERSKRIRPGLDDKQLTSWNALMITGYCDAYNALGEKKYLYSAKRNAELLLSKVKTKEGNLHHTFKNGKAAINGYLEDYSFFIEALLKLYECTFDVRLLDEALELARYVRQHFYDDETGMFFFTSGEDPKLIARKKEIHDNVIPASNSSMAKSLFLLGKFFSDNGFISLAQGMLRNVQQDMISYGSSFSNWGILLIWNVHPFYEVVIAGEEAEIKMIELNQHYLPAKIIAGTKKSELSLTLLENRFVEGKTLIYVCENNTCKLPVEEVNEALAIL